MKVFVLLSALFLTHSVAQAFPTTSPYDCFIEWGPDSGTIYRNTFEYLGNWRSSENYFSYRNIGYRAWITETNTEQVAPYFAFAIQRFTPLGSSFTTDMVASAKFTAFNEPFYELKINPMVGERFGITFYCQRRQ